jgi:hypothetical protein
MKSVVICGSSRFALEIRDFTKKLKNLGVIVYEPYLYRASGGVWENIPDHDKPLVATGLTHVHFYKIRMADVVYVFNKDGYSGVSTTLEIGYAAALNKPIYAFSEGDEEICRKIVFSGFIDNVEDLMKYL